MLTKEQLELAEKTGREWGEIEVENWKDQHDGSLSKSPEWTAGTYCGGFPDGLDEQSRNEYESTLDDFAKEVWDFHRGLC